MFFTFQQRLLLGVYIFLILSIPIGSYLASQHQTTKSAAKEQKEVKPIVQTTPKPTNNPAKELLSATQKSTADTELESSSDTSSPTIATSFGPTLSLQVNLEGRPAGKQATGLFVGLVEGSLSTNPKFLLSFNIDLPEGGAYSDLALAGLTPGTRYTALLKAPAQIATSSAFIVSPTVTNLNSGKPLTLLTGDLNEDNMINSSDYSIVQKAIGSTSSSANWNALADFNKDGVINTFDLTIISRNLGKIGASGTWTSPIPQIGTSSASLNNPSGSPNSPQGYWLWVPGF